MDLAVVQYSMQCLPIVILNEDLLDDEWAGGVAVILGLDGLPVEGGSEVSSHHPQLAGWKENQECFSFTK